MIRTARTYDLLGQRFGRLVVVAYVGVRGDKRCWQCRCDCGGETVAATGSLRSGKVLGCSRDRRKHGESAGGKNRRISKEYRAWVAMFTRCTNPNSHAWAHYGGRGIRISERWRNFGAFLSDMGRAPSPQHSIDRIDVNGDYTPENCRWATLAQQNANKSSCIFLEFQGERLPLLKWAERTQISPTCLYQRFYKGWPVERMLTEPPEQRRSR